MECPRQHGSMESIHLSADLMDPQEAFFCSDCHGIWMRARECRSVLGIDSTRLQIQSESDYVPLVCPHCQTTFRLSFFDIDADQRISIRVCPRCQSCFFDGGGFAQVFYQQVKIERVTTNLLSNTPLDALGWRCVDCQSPIDSLEGAFDGRVGCCCSRCRYTPPVLSGGKIQNVQLVTFHNMEIKIDHWMSTTRSRIAVTPVEPCLLDVSIYPLRPVQRFFRFGHRTTQFGGALRRHLDATQSIATKTPFHVFLNQRGVAECLYDLVSMGNITITFKPHCMIFEMDAFRLGTEVRQRFESIIRRMLIAYERFVALSHRYRMPEQEEAQEPLHEDD